MKTERIMRMYTALRALALFREVLDDPVMEALLKYCKMLDGRRPSAVQAYGEFVAALYTANGGDLARHIETLINRSENVYVRMAGRGETPPPHLQAALTGELAVLQQIAGLTTADLTAPLDFDGFLPAFSGTPVDLASAYAHRLENVGKYGYGQYAEHPMFCIDVMGKIVPVRHPDPILPDMLVAYTAQRQKIIDNTRALLAGKPAANILLTGDAGTGKSSTVKAVGNAFYAEGLRVVELRKEQLRFIPKILEELAQNPLKFILFIDDLAFADNDDGFNMLKALLEGSVSARSRNVVVYATSNRRHILRERFSDREGDDIHRRDSMQESISLADRFGMHITFGQPDKAIFLHIVRTLAARDGITMPPQELELLAERFALERGGRSARLARQFVDSLLSTHTSDGMISPPQP